MSDDDDFGLDPDLKALADVLVKVGARQAREAAEAEAKDAPPRKKYEPPKLIEFGPIGQLTMAGTGGWSEPSMGPNMNDPARML